MFENLCTGPHETTPRNRFRYLLLAEILARSAGTGENGREGVIRWSLWRIHKDIPSFVPVVQ
jgi:hypothetical protein